MRVLLRRKQMPFDPHYGLPLAVMVTSGVLGGVITAARAVRIDDRAAFTTNAPSPPVYDPLPWVRHFRDESESNEIK